MGNKKGYWAGSKNPKFKHGLLASHKKACTAWYDMHRRCYNPKSKLYSYYGARGITVAQEWNEFSQFLTDMGDPDQGHSLERIDNSKGYSKNNCKWADRLTQANNTRYNIRLTVGEITLTISEWSRKTGIRRGTIAGRINRGWLNDKILSKQNYRGQKHLATIRGPLWKKRV